MHLETTGVLGRKAVDAVDDAGVAGVRGIGENGGSDRLGIDANDNTSLSAETAMPETSADEVETEAVGSDEGPLCEGPLLLTAAEAGCFAAFRAFKSTKAAPLSDPEKSGGVDPEPSEDPKAAGGGGIAHYSAPNSSEKVVKAADITDAEAELVPPETVL
ncbi:unnamed protein product [Phytophthora fragariaefolia]|uniref:Unnamed protein product n=1 Tax=Phytophthora fragariaefolia TaxID=1490495 RepID=A0A9W6WL72_9STRA|nr:unnamed protein product [Phytophthora fragariaefolia]